MTSIVDTEPEPPEPPELPELPERAAATTDAQPAGGVPTVEVPAGGRVLVASDLHLGALADATSEATSTELARHLAALNGPAVLVLAGDTFELWAEPNNTPAKALRSHPRLSEAVRRFAAGPHRRVVVLAGNHDGAIGWDPTLAAEVRAGLNATVAPAVDLLIETGAGVERIRIEHGHQLDRFNAFTDPAQAGDRPLGHHVVRELLPALRRAGGDERWLADLDGLVDPSLFPRYLASRLIYRRLVRHLWWLVVPLVLVGLLRLSLWIGGLVQRGDAAPHGVLQRLVAAAPLLSAGVLVDAGLLLVGLLVAGRRSVAALQSLDVGLSSFDGDANHNARRRAVALQAEGYRGLITGHTHQAEICDLNGGFYANSGCNADVVVPVRGRGGLPTVFRAARRSTWLQLDAGPELALALWSGEVPTSAPTRLERLAAPTTGSLPVKPAVVARLAPHRSWPSLVRVDGSRRTRRLAAASVAVIGGLDLVSALTPPLRVRIHHLLAVAPSLVPATASLATAAAGFGLLLLAGGLRRGQRRAWTVALSLLGLSVAANLAKGLDVEEASLALVVTGYLLANGASFRARADQRSGRRAGAVLVGMVAATAAAAVAVSLVGHVPLSHVAGNFSSRLFGLGGAPLPHRWRPVSAAITGMGLCTLAVAGWLVFRPHRSPHLEEELDAKAWQLVKRYGRGTLDYFALRDDKTRFIHEHTVVAYAVRRGVAVVSPDPIGPADERARAWAAFRRHAADNGWSIAVLGAGEGWLSTYADAAMKAIYAGDEAVVDVRGFSLEGGRNKNLRQAVNRVAKAGYQVRFYRSGELPESKAAELRAIMGHSRRGDVERGFSMTLSRLFDRRDHELLLAVADGPDGHAAAFCQYVPAAGINGYSLDLMRRADAGQPNGLTDFVVVRTIEYLQSLGCDGLGLNFATMRAVLAGDVSDSWWNRRQRAVLMRMGKSMQIESLWRFNAKYDPQWLPRYLVIDGSDTMLSAAWAIAAAESWWELPVIGRFLRPRPVAPVPARDDAAPSDVEDDRAAAISGGPHRGVRTSGRSGAGAERGARPTPGMGAGQPSPDANPELARS